jgi:hypothetical protein
MSAVAIVFTGLILRLLLGSQILLDKQILIPTGVSINLGRNENQSLIAVGSPLVDLLRDLSRLVDAAALHLVGEVVASCRAQASQLCV